MNTEKGFKPAVGRYLVDRTPKKVKSTGGVELPGTSYEIPADGIIIACGNGRLRDGVREEVEWKKGDHIFYSRYTDEEIVIDDKHFFLVRFEHVQGFLK